MGEHPASAACSYPSAILYGMVASGVTAVLGIEALSALGMVRQLPLDLLAVGAVLVFAAVLRAKLRGAGPIAWSRPAHPFLLGCLLALAGVTLVIALASAPNTWDSMTYHLARVAEWYDHGSVEHYYTTIDRQLWQPPFGEYLMLLTYGGLGGRDYLTNLPQWLAAVGAVLAVMEIARLLGAPARSRYIAGLFTATAPIVILESTATHTDLLGGLWIAIAAWLALAQYLSPRFTARDALWFGAAIGLGAGTKGTSIPTGLPWVLLFLLAAMRPFRPRALAVQAAAIGLAALALTGSYFLRNLATYGNPIGPATAQRMLRPASMQVPAVASNLAAHLSLELGTPWRGVNDVLRHGVVGLTTAMGLDPSGLYPYFGGFRIMAWSTSEDIAGNPVHAVLGLLALGLLVATWRRVTLPERLMAGGLIAGVVLFALAIRWQPFVARLHAPIVILLSPCLLVFLERRSRGLGTAGLTAALVLAIPPLFSNGSRPIVPTHTSQTRVAAPSVLVAPRDVQYFANRPGLYEPYRSAIAAIARLGCTRVGLVAGYDSWEYPLWALGRRGHLSFEHYPPADPAPTGGPRAGPRWCAVVALDRPKGWRPPDLPRDAEPVLDTGPVTVWH